MRTPAKFLLPLFVILSLTSPAQTTMGNDTWGPWESHPGFLHLHSRAKCDYTMNADDTSVWDYQFRNNYTYPVDFIEKEEGFNKRAGVNTMGAPGQLSLGSGEISPAMSTTLKGSCQELGGLKVAVLCVVEKGEADKCYEKLGLKKGTLDVHESPASTKAESQQAEASETAKAEAKQPEPSGLASQLMSTPWRCNNIDPEMGPEHWWYYLYFQTANTFKNHNPTNNNLEYNDSGTWTLNPTGQITLTFTYSWNPRDPDVGEHPVRNAVFSGGNIAIAGPAFKEYPATGSDSYNCVPFGNAPPS